MYFKKDSIIKSEKAQAMIEFILVFPVFILMIFGIIEFSLLSLAHQNVNYASFNAARAEIVGNDPSRSAWMTLYMLTPHYVENLSPLHSFNITYPELGFSPVSFNNKFTLLKLTVGSPCLLELLGAKDPLIDFEASLTLFGNTVRNAEELINSLLAKIAGAASELISGAIDMTNDEMNDAGYAMPPFIRKALYAMSFVEIDKVEFDSKTSPSVKVDVTYYYILKFPVIRSIFRYFFKMRKINEDAEVFKGEGSKWLKAQKLSEKSGLTFIPITHSCLMGNEKKICP